MKYLYLSALYLLFGFTAQTLSQEINQGSRITALGNTGVAISDIWSLQSNQSGIAALDKPMVAVSYRNSYLNPEISTQSAVIAYPIKQNVIGLSFQNYGFSAYREQKFGFTYAKRFGNTISASLNFNLHQVSITQYGNAKAYSVEVGLQYKVDEKLTLGTHIANPNKTGFETDVDAVIPVCLEFGASYKFTDKVFLNSGLVKTLSSVTDLRCGLEYSAINWLAFRGGISANPFRQFAGFGCQLNDLKLDAATSTHPQLGFSPQIALSYEF